MDREKEFTNLLEGLVTLTSEFADAIGIYAEALEIASEAIDEIAHPTCEGENHV